MDVNDRIRKFNASAFDVLMNSADLSEVVRCQLIVTKCLPILLYGNGGVSIDNEASYMLYISYRKIFRYIFRLSLRAHLTELLEVFNVQSVAYHVNKKAVNMLKQGLSSHFEGIKFLTSCVLID